MTDLRIRQIEDHGSFGVFWYRDGRGEPMWARVEKDVFDPVTGAFAWKIGYAKGGFASRDAAIADRA